MTILVVDNIIDRLEALSASLREMFPQATVRSEADPYAAGKYCLFHPVDLVFTELEPGKMDAIQLKGLIQNTNPQAKVFITGKPQSLFDWEIVDEKGKPIEPDICGALGYPVTAEKLQKALACGGQRGGAKQ